MRRLYPVGIDCVWLASDQVGHLGAFVSAGKGPIPAVALESADLPIEDVERHLCGLPRVSRAQLLVSVKQPDDFVDLAERGLFVYDWTDIHRTIKEERGVYESVASPTEPINVNSLPSDLMILAVALRFPNIEFAAGIGVDVRSLLSCVETE